MLLPQSHGQLPAGGDGASSSCGPSQARGSSFRWDQEDPLVTAQRAASALLEKYVEQRFETAEAQDQARSALYEPFLTERFRMNYKAIRDADGSYAAVQITFTLELPEGLRSYSKEVTAVDINNG